MTNLGLFSDLHSPKKTQLSLRPDVIFLLSISVFGQKIEQIMVLHSLELDLRIDFETDNFDFDLDFLPKHTLNE